MKIIIKTKKKKKKALTGSFVISGKEIERVLSSYRKRERVLPIEVLQSYMTDSFKKQNEYEKEQANAENKKAS